MNIKNSLPFHLACVRIAKVKKLMTASSYVDVRKGEHIF